MTNVLGLLSKKILNAWAALTLKIAGSLRGVPAFIPFEVLRLHTEVVFFGSMMCELSVKVYESYGVDTKILNRAVKRNLDRFPKDFMFQLLQEEFQNLRCPIGTSSLWGSRRYLPYVFAQTHDPVLQGIRKIQTSNRVPPLIPAVQP